MRVRTFWLLTTSEVLFEGPDLVFRLGLESGSGQGQIQGQGHRVRLRNKHTNGGDVCSAGGEGPADSSLRFGV